jgi:Pyruvate/2-oxoacid:ferredoxin oxidoreductase delta subunit
MINKRMRKIIQIDEKKCNGCGSCITACAEGALALIDGKAKLVNEVYCDGLAACIGKCPEDALQIVEKESLDFDEAATATHLNRKAKSSPDSLRSCPGIGVRELGCSTESPPASSRQSAKLSHWPVQMALVPSGARFLEDADVVLIADCVPFAYPNLHQDFLKDRSVLVACPKLDDTKAHLDKLTDILLRGNIRSMSVVHMEVPCCSGLSYIARQALLKSDKNIPFKEITVGIKGDIKAEAIGV